MNVLANTPGATATPNRQVREMNADDGQGAEVFYGARLDPQRLVALFRAHWWLFALVAAAIFLLAVAYTAVAPRIFTSTASVVLEAPSEARSQRRGAARPAGGLRHRRHRGPARPVARHRRAGGQRAEAGPGRHLLGRLAPQGAGGSGPPPRRGHRRGPGRVEGQALGPDVRHHHRLLLARSEPGCAHRQRLCRPVPDRPEPGQADLQQAGRLGAERQAGEPAQGRLVRRRRPGAVPHRPWPLQHRGHGAERAGGHQLQ